MMKTLDDCRVAIDTIDNEILELSEKELSVSVIVAIGYRSSGDKTQY